MDEEISFQRVLIVLREFSHEESPADDWPAGVELRPADQVGESYRDAGAHNMSSSVLEDDSALVHLKDVGGGPENLLFRVPRRHQHRVPPSERGPAPLGPAIPRSEVCVPRLDDHVA